MKRILSLACAIVLLAGCSDNNSPIDNEELAELKVYSPLVQTRGPLSSNYGELPAQIFIKKGADADFKAATSSEITFNRESTDAVGFDTPIYWPTNQSALTLAGFSPQGWTKESDGTISSPVFDGKTDLVYTAQTTAVYKDYPTLAFHHLLTLLRFSIVTDDINYWKSVTGIYIVGGYNQGAVNPDGLTNKLIVNPMVIKAPINELSEGRSFGTSSLNAGAGFPVYKLDAEGGFTDELLSTTNSYTPTKVATAVAYSIVSPLKRNWTKDLNYSILLEIDGTIINPSGTNIKLGDLPEGLEKNSTAGRIFDITLNLSTISVKAEATVSDWDTGVTGGADFSN